MTTGSAEQSAELALIWYVDDMSKVKLPGKAKQNNLPPECGQPIDAGEFV
jgi:hypothetical protein